jgi:hypothetical protein
VHILKYGRFREQVLLARKAETPLPKFAAGYGIAKDAVLPIVTQVAERTVRFVISTSNPDRDNDTVAVSGWDLTAYMRNPVVMFAHGYDPTLGSMPVGRAIDVGPDNGVLMATVQFKPEDRPVAGRYAEEILRDLEEGYLAATSVGFRPLDYSVTEDPARGGDSYFPGIDFARQELLEFSIVTVPANAEALRLRPEETDDVPVGAAPPVITETARAAEAQEVKEPARRKRRPFAFI